MRIGRAALKAWMWVLTFSVGATGLCFAQDRQNASADMTKQQLLKSLEDLEVKLLALQTPGFPPMVSLKVAPEDEKRRRAAEGERIETDRKRIEKLEAPDVRIEALEVRERESGVTRLQRHQSELTTQKLGNQVIILNTNP